MDLEKVGDVARHLVNVGGVESLQIFESSLVLACDEIDGDTFTPESTTATDPAKQLYVIRGQLCQAESRRDGSDLWM